MKHVRRWLAILLCAVLVSGFVPEGTLLARAEEAQTPVPAVEAPASEATEPVAEEGESPSEEGTPQQQVEEAIEEVAEPEPQTEQAQTPQQEDQPQQEAQPQQAPEEKPEEIDTSRSADFSPAFVLGYARILKDAPAYPDASKDAEPLATLYKDGIVYVSNRKMSSSIDRLEVNFSCEDREPVTAWMDASALRPMSEEEAEDFVLTRMEEQDVEYYRQNAKLPLALLKCQFEKAQQEPLEIPTEFDEQSVETSLRSTAALSSFFEIPAGEITLYLGRPEQIAPERMFGSAVQGTVTWSIDGNAATVSQTGLLTPVAEGRATLRAVVNGVTARASVIVKELAMSLNVESLTLGVGETRVLTTSFTDEQKHTVTFSSAKKAVASVSAAGAIKGVKTGTTTVTVTSDFGQTIEVKVTVKKAPASVSLQAKSVELGVGEEYNLVAKLPGGTASALSFSSSNASVASVDAQGRVKALNKGTTKITVKTFNNKKATATVKVYAAPTSATLDQKTLQMGVGQTAKLKAQLPQDSRASCSYTSDTPAVASVDGKTGAVTAVAIGTAKITLTTHNGLTDTCQVTVGPAPTGISLAEQKITLGVGQTSAPLAVKLEGAGDPHAGLTFKSSNAKIVIVSAAGALKAVKTGTATVTVTTHNGKSAKVSVVVKKAPASVKVSPTKATLGVGERGQLKLTLPKDTACGVTYSGYDPAIVSVSETGEVQALAKGTTKITVRTHNKKTATSTITVKAAPESISLNAAEKTMGVGQSWTIKAQADDGSDVTCSFASGNDKVAQVDASGTVRAVAVGTAVITVKSYNDKTAICNVTVKAAPSTISLGASTLTLGVNETFGPLNVKMGADGENCEGSYTLKSSNAKIVKIDANGNIKALKTGSATVTVTSHNGKTAKLAVTVKKAPTKLTISPSSATLGVGETGQLKWTLPTGTAGRVGFSGYDGGIISVSDAGLVTAIAPGTTTITAKTFNGKTAKVSITVKSAPTGVRLNPGSLEMGAGEARSLQAVLSDGSAGRVAFTSDNESVAKVDASKGTVTALRAGTANITVRTYNGYAATCSVRVNAAPTGIKFQEGSLTIAVGDDYALLPLIVQGDGAVCSSFTYTTSNAKIAKVSAAGVIHGVKAGKATIKATTYNKKTASITVTVKGAPASVAFAQAQIDLGPGERYVPTVTFPGGMKCSYQLTSTDSAVLAVEADGRTLRAVSPGTAEVQVRSFNGKTANMTVRVLLPPEKVELSAHNIAVGQRGTRQLRATMPENQGSALTFTSSNARIASVDATGLVTGVNPGTATITVRTTNGKTDSCAVTVYAAPTNVTLTPAIASRGIDEQTLQLTVSFGLPGEGGDYTFTSSNPSIATVSASGLVTFVKPGAVKIVVTTYNNYTAETILTITQAPTSIAFEAAETKLAVGDAAVLPVKFTGGSGSYTLTAADPEVLSVEGEQVRGLQTGSTQVTATTYNGLTATCTVRIVEAPTQVLLDWESLELSVGEQRKLVARTNAEDGVGSCTFSTSNASVASVDAATGLITARGLGEAVITATAYNGLASATCRVKVTGKPAYRALIAGEFAGTTKESLPFSRNNVNGMAAALRLSSVNGTSYSIVSGVNQGKTRILNAIRTQFADAQPYDVSVIYLVAHGLRQYGGSGEYVLTMTNFEKTKTSANYITATELMAAINTVPGKVILILDSCYSGGFLDRYGSLVSGNPNLAVLCSTHGSTKSSYWDVTGSNAVDFYTYALLEGLGYEEKTGATLQLKADLNGDGKVTVREAAAYATSRTIGYVSDYSSDPRFNGPSNQMPQYNISGMEDIVLVGR